MTGHTSRTYFLFFLLILFLASSDSIVFGHNIGGVRNLRIRRVDPGGSNDRMVASWDHPSGVDSADYLVRRNIRYPGEGWTGWSSSNSVSGTSANLLSVTGVFQFDIRVSVELVAHNSVHASSTATLCGIRGDSATSSGSSCGGGSSRASGSSRTSAVTETKKPAAHTCRSLSSASNGISVSSSAGLESGIQCKRLDGPGIGIASIVEAGFTSGVDVWGTVKDALVCFEFASGLMLFLDAADSPRTATPIESFAEEGKVCASIDRPGSLVLIPAQGAVTADPSEQTAVSPRSVSGCMVTTNTYVSFRESPGGPNVLFYVRPEVTMYATSRIDDWFSVRLLDTDGWISARYAVSEGICG